MPDQTADAAAAANPDSQDQDGSWWKWLLGGLLLGATGVGAFLLLKQRRGSILAPAVPEIVRPTVRPQPRPSAKPADDTANPPATRPATAPAALPKVAAGPLDIEIQPRNLSMTLMAATLAYRIRIANTSGADLENVTVEADLISAHAAQPQHEQLADRNSVMETRHRIDRIAAGEFTELSGDLRLPLTQMRAIKQGNTTLFVPLSRFTVRAAGHIAVINVIVGAPGPNGGVSPVVIDRGPHIVKTLAARSF